MPSFSRSATFSFTSHLSCMHFFIEKSPQRNDQTIVNDLFVVLYPGSLRTVYLKNYWMIFYHWSWLCISSESWHDHFVGIFGHQLLLEPNIHCHTKLHYECSCCKLWLYFSKGLSDWLTGEITHEAFLMCCITDFCNGDNLGTPIWR